MNEIIDLFHKFHYLIEKKDLEKLFKIVDNDKDGSFKIFYD